MAICFTRLHSLIPLQPREVSVLPSGVKHPRGIACILLGLEAPETRTHVLIPHRCTLMYKHTYTQDHRALSLILSSIYRARDLVAASLESERRVLDVWPL